MFQSYVWHRCHDLLTMSRNLNDIYILNIKNRRITSGISKSEAIKLLQNIDLSEVEHYLKIDIKSNFEAINFLQILI